MKALLFDMDGVLIDVSRSYREAARKTAAFFLGYPVDSEIIQTYKDGGDLNNDWDLVERLLRDREKRVDREKLVSVFQEIYLGCNGDGLMRYETWLPEPGLLDSCRKNVLTGIVTGRPRNDAELALRRFGTADLFDVLITMDDLNPGEQKPHPAGIRLAMSRLKAGEGFYLGDTVDDMAAAVRGGLKPVGVNPPGADSERSRRRLLETGALMVLDSVNELREVVL